MQNDLQDKEKGQKDKKLEILESKLSQVAFSQSDMPTEMEKKFVYQVYDKIAPHFSHTRYKPWPRVQAFLNEIEEGSIVYDVGCGNGKYMGVNKNLFMIGTDRSIGLLKTANQKSQNYELFSADSLYLPLKSQTCDAFISIAVIHHFSNDQLRHKAINQLTRITKIGGIGLIYVWAFEQDYQGQQSTSKKSFKQQDVFVPWHLSFKYQSDLQNIDHQGCQIDKQKKSVIYKRYYHVFKKQQLENLILKHDNLQLVESYYDRENWCCKVKRIK